MSVTGTQVNPYIGPRPFRTGDTLYGRDWETEELRDLLIARRFVLLHSPSGAGKTSLIQAGLIPALKDEGFRVLPPIRVGIDPPPSIQQAGGSFNRFVLSVHISLGNTLAEMEGAPTDLHTMRDSSLDMLCERIMRAAAQTSVDPVRTVLIFDQFEEILTVDPLDRAARTEFFEQLGAALKSRDRWALFALREDYVAGLEPYLHDVPTRLSTHFRLDPLRKEAALEAIRQPALSQGVSFAEGVAEMLVDDLLTVPLGKSEFVEPVQLQVVCYDLWEHWRANSPPDATTITQEHLAAFGDVEQALSDFYDTCIESTTKQTGIPERELRHWFDHQLITPAETRGIVYKGARETAGIPNAAVNVLDRLHIIRVEPRAGADWVELTHDGFIKPIQDANRGWEQRQWDHTRRQFKRALITGVALLALVVLILGTLTYLSGQEASQAEQLASNVEATSTAQAEIQAKADAEAQRQAQRATADAQRTATVFAVTQHAANAVATQTTLVSQSERLIAGARVALQNNDAALALSLALESYALNPALTDALRTLADAAYAPGPRKMLTTGTTATFYSQLALSPDERYVVYAPGLTPQTEIQQRALTASDYALTVWDLETGEMVRRLERHTSRVIDVAYAYGSPHNRILSVSQNAIIVWDAITGEVLSELDLGLIPGLESVTLTSAALAPDGSAALAGGCSRRDINSTCQRGIVLWFDLASFAAPIAFDVRSASSVTGVSFAPQNQAALAVTGNGEFVQCHRPYAQATRSGCILVPTIQTDPSQRAQSAPRPSISSLAVDADSQLALLGLQDGTLLVWDIANRRSVRRLDPAHTGVVRGVDFGADENSALSVGEDGRMIWWDLTTGNPIRSFTFEQQSIWDVVYRQTGTAAITALGNNSLIWWDLLPGDQKRDIITFEPVTALAFHPDGQRLITGSASGQVMIWSANGIVESRFQAGAGPITTIAFSESPAADVAITLAPDRTLLVWRGATSTPAVTGLTAINTVVLSPDGQTFFVAGCQDTQLLTRECRAGALVQMDTATLTILQVISGNDSNTTAHLRGVTSMALSPDGKKLFTGAENGTLAVWDVSSGTGQAVTSESPAATITDVALLAQDGQLYGLSAGCLTREDTSQLCSQGALLLWNLTSGQLIRRFPTTSAEIIRAAFSADGQSVIAGAADGVISRWDFATGQLIINYTGHTGPITGLVFQPNPGPEKQWFASSATDSHLILWRLDTLEDLLGWTICNRIVPDTTAINQRFEQMDISPTCGIAQAESAPTAAETPEATPPAQAEITPQPIRIGETLAAHDDSVAHYWTFDGTAGDRISIALSSDEQRIEGIIMLYYPDGRELASVAQAANTVLLSGFVLPQSGTYTIVTQRLTAGETGYSVTLSSLRTTTATPRPSPTPPAESANQQATY